MRLDIGTTTLSHVRLECALSRYLLCGEYHASLNARLQIASSSLSRNRYELPALLDVAQDSFNRAAAVERFCVDGVLAHVRRWLERPLWRAPAPRCCAMQRGAPHGAPLDRRSNDPGHNPKNARFFSM
jgi:hypothetical protein